MYRHFVLGGLVVAYLLSITHAKGDSRLRVQYIVSKEGSDAHSFVMSGSECTSVISSVQDNGRSSLMLKSSAMKCDSDITLKDHEKGLPYDRQSRILTFASAHQAEEFKKLLLGNSKVEIRILDQNCIQEKNKLRDCVVDSPVVKVKGPDGKKVLVAVALPRQVKIQVNSSPEKTLDAYFDGSGISGSGFRGALVEVEGALAAMPGSPLASARSSDMVKVPDQTQTDSNSKPGDRKSDASHSGGAENVGPESAFP